MQEWLMCRLRCWKTRRGMANAKGVNEIISTFPVLWEVLWLTPPDSVEQETKLDPPDLGLQPKLSKLLTLKLYKWQTIQHGKIQIYFANYDICKTQKNYKCTAWQPFKCIMNLTTARVQSALSSYLWGLEKLFLIFYDKLALATFLQM